MFALSFSNHFFIQYFLLLDLKVKTKNFCAGIHNRVQVETGTKECLFRLREFT